MVWTRSERICYAAEGWLAIKIAEVRERIFGLFDYDTELPVRDVQLESLNGIGWECEYERHFYEEMFREMNVIGRDHAARKVYVRKLAVGEIELEDASTSGRSAESETEMSESEEEVGVDQFLDFPRRLVSYPPRSDVFKEFYKAKVFVGGRWGNCIEYADRKFRYCTVATGEEYFYLLADLTREKRDKGIDESISLEYFNRNAQSELSKGFLCYLSQLKYGLSLPLSNLAKGIMNLIGACPVQINGNMWEMTSICEPLNTRWEGDERRRRISSKDVLQFYGVKNYSASGGAYFFASSTRPRFFNLNSTAQKSQVGRKESLLDILAQEDTELKAVLEELGISRNKRVNSRAKKVQKSQLTRLMTSVEGSKKKGTDGERRVNFPKPLGATRLMKGICLGVEEERVELKRKKVELERNAARLKTDLIKEGKWMEGDTYVEKEENEEIKDVVVGVVDGLDGVSSQMVKDNQGDDNEHPEGETEKVHIKFVEAAQTAVDLPWQIVEKDAEIEKKQKELAKLREHAAKLKSQNDALMVKNREADMACYRIQALEKLKEGLNRSMASLNNDLIKKTNNHKQTQADLVNSRSELERLKKKLGDKDNELKRARDDLSASEVAVEQLNTDLPAKDFEFWMVQRKCDELNEKVAQLKTELAQANSCARHTEAGERSRKNKNNVKVSLVQGDVVSLSARIRELQGGYRSNSRSCAKRS
ncbi:hypothetical protein GIB67_035897 [Kingdonia uniflora]|uniref:Uncharacterized protein n=1 Tax=Kingdonia uniflora TaxID=39325 RepID=A0A7J7P8V7_9MAGN|nr:hypothetical protein GIB67_035897 [Kingdonia uniflora]